MAVSRQKWVVNNEKYTFLVLLNFLTFLENAFYAFNQKHVRTAIAEMSS